MSSKEIGAFPYYIEKGQLMVVLVTNRKGTRWILPKGQQEDHLKLSEVALMEAYEEAGVVGKLSSIDYSECNITREKQKVKLRLYPVQVEKLLNDWPESDTRKRISLPAHKAQKKVGKKALRRCIKQFTKQILARKSKSPSYKNFRTNNKSTHQTAH